MEQGYILPEKYHEASCQLYNLTRRGGGKGTSTHTHIREESEKKLCSAPRTDGINSCLSYCAFSRMCSCKYKGGRCYDESAFKRKDDTTRAASNEMKLLGLMFLGDTVIQFWL